MGKLTEYWWEESASGSDRWRRPEWHEHPSRLAEAASVQRRVRFRAEALRRIGQAGLPAWMLAEGVVVAVTVRAQYSICRVLFEGESGPRPVLAKNLETVVDLDLLPPDGQPSNGEILIARWEILARALQWTGDGALFYVTRDGELRADE